MSIGANFMDLNYFLQREDFQILGKEPIHTDYSKKVQTNLCR